MKQSKQHKNQRWSLHLREMIKSCEKILNYTSGMQFEEFEKDTKTYEAVIRNFEILGEAVRHIPSAIMKSNPDVEWKKMNQLRNFLIHQYLEIDSKILWDTIEEKIGPLLKTLKKVKISDPF